MTSEALYRNDGRIKLLYHFEYPLTQLVETLGGNKNDTCPHYVLEAKATSGLRFSRLTKKYPEEGTSRDKRGNIRIVFDYL